MDSMGGKITFNLKELHQNRKRMHTHTRKELEAHLVQKGRLSCNSDAPQVESARSDSTRVVEVNRHKTNCRKMRPYCIYLTVSVVHLKAQSFAKITVYNTIQQENK
jgi:hypothetical protein